VAGLVGGLEPGQPRVDLRGPEPEFAADAEATWAAALATEVVQRLHAYREPGGQLGQGEDRPAAPATPGVVAAVRVPAESAVLMSVPVSVAWF